MTEHSLGKPWIRLLALVAFAGALCGTQAFAHKVHVFAQSDGSTIRGEAYFHGKAPVKNAKVTVLNPAGRVLEELKTDEEGKFSFTARFHCDHRLVVEAGHGHTAEFIIKADEFKGMKEQSKATGSFTLHPIGRVEKKGKRTMIILDEKYQPGLLGLDGFSHVYVYWWFDRNDTSEKRATLQIHPSPPGNTAHPLTGVFATRSPFRPNLIGMTLCKIISVKQNIVEIDGIDAFADTPVLDMKPHVPRFDAASNATIPWWLMRKGQP